MNNSLFRRKNIAQAIHESQHGNGLLKTLSLRDLISFGIAAIIGAGIFSTIGLASYNGGPAVSLLFVFVAILSFVSRVSFCIFKSKPYCFVHLIKPINVAGSEVVGSVAGHFVPAFLLQCDYCHTILRISLDTSARIGACCQGNGCNG